MEQQLPVIILTLLVMGAGFACGLRSRRQTHLFWRDLVAGACFLAPLMLGGFTWYEEAFVVAFLAGNPPRGIARLRGVAHLIFIAFALYMAFEAARGILLLESIRKIRWVGFFLLLVALYYRLAVAWRDHPPDVRLAHGVCAGGLGFHLLYIFWGVVAEAMGTSRFDAQAPMATYGYTNSILAVWAPTAYSAFTLVAIVPAAIISIDESRGHRRLLGWLTLLVVVVSTLFYDSRVGGLYLALCIGLWLLFGQVRRLIGVAVVLAAVFMFDASIITIGGDKDFMYYLDDLSQSGAAMWGEPQAERRDLGRRVYLEAAYPALTETTTTLWFGHGFRVSGYAVAPYVNELLLLYGRQPIGEETVGTEAITNLTVDTGVVGLGLTAVLFIIGAVQLVRSKSRHRPILLLSLLVTLVWLFVINVIDVMALYWILMPNGLFLCLARAAARPAPVPVRRLRGQLAARALAPRLRPAAL